MQDMNQTLGVCSILNGKMPIFSSISLERGWRNNEPKVSCIPEGIYNVVLEHSPAFKKLLWEIKGVDNRTECKFHSANYWLQLNGCIALGDAVGLLNADKYYDILNSRRTLEKFEKALLGLTECKLIVRSPQYVKNI